jgi:methanogenic corrinoid protein MtbC1
MRTLLTSETRHWTDAKKVVCACPEGELHEGGLMAFAVHAVASGLEVVYLGPNTPIQETLVTAEAVQARVVARSLTRPLGKPQRTKLLSTPAGLEIRRL